jgi:hypothetical protein
MRPTKRGIAGFLLIACAFAAGPPAQAGFFERLFGGFRFHAPRHVEPRDLPQMSPLPGDRVVPQGGSNDWRPRSEGGPRSAFCVRTCDGHFFPVHAHAGFSAAQMCTSFCPASETKLYVGGGIDHAVGTDGKRYTDLPQAFAYRKQLVGNCTCNGKDAFGLARIDVNTDPTLQRGDVIATRRGMMVVSGKGENGAQLTPVDSYNGFSQSQRQKLADIEPTPSRHRPPQTEGRAPSIR